MIIPYNASKEERDRITAEREKKLYQSFENMRKQIDDQIQTMNFSTVSERVKRQQLEEIRHELQKQLQGHYNALEAGLKDDMVEVGGAVLKESEAFYSALQMPIGMSITSFPVEIMNNVVNGSVYQEKWYLSKALWGDYTEKLDQINEVISNGIGLNLPSFEIAKQLEQYVDPSAMTPSKTIVTHCLQDPVTGKLYSMDYVKRHPEKDWTGFKEKDSRFRYGKVDYNAQRLARTLINHAYQQNVVHQAQANPFATGVRWDASGGERMCEICEERDGKIFPTDDVPLDHPNGMCTFEVVTDLNMMEMSDVLADFVKGEPTEYDDKLYAWYNDRAVNPEQKPVKQEKVEVNKNRDNLPEDIINIIGYPGEPIDPDELLKTINPGWKGMDRYYRQNCQRCASSFELGRRGYSLEAKPFNGSYPDWRLFMNGKEFIDGKGYRVRKENGSWRDIPDSKYLFNRSPKITAKSLIAAMQDWGVGSRATLTVTWRNSTTSHIVNVENVNGVVTIFDAQPGIKYTNIEDYLSKTKCAETELARTDDAEFKDFDNMREATYNGMISRMETMFKKR